MSAVPGALGAGKSGRRPRCLGSQVESEGAAPLSTAGGSLGASLGRATSYLSEVGVPSRAVPVTQSRSGEKPSSLEAQVADTNFLLSPELVNTLPLG